jgi:hypothetical protein
MDRAVQACHGLVPRQRATRADARPSVEGLVGTRILNVSVGWKISGNFAPQLPEKNVGRIFSQQNAGLRRPRNLDHLFASRSHSF